MLVGGWIPHSQLVVAAGGVGPAKNFSVVVGRVWGITYFPVEEARKRMLLQWRRRGKHVDRVEEFLGKYYYYLHFGRHLFWMQFPSACNRRRENEELPKWNYGVWSAHSQGETDRQRALMICRRYLFISSSSCSPSIQRARDNLIPQMAFITVHCVTQ